MNNSVLLVGTMDDVTAIHCHDGECFYDTHISVARRSGSLDVIPVTVPERVVENLPSGKAYITGSFRSRQVGSGKHLYVLARTVAPTDMDDTNVIILCGNVENKPAVRVTPSGREIADITLEVFREYGVADHIPCIAWGRNARYLSSCHMKNDLYVVGRLQSRTYEKNGTHHTYEVSISSLY